MRVVVAPIRLPDTAETLTAAGTNQLWRNALLAAMCEKNGVATTAAVAVVAFEGDAKAELAVKGLRAAMHSPGTRCLAVSFQQLVGAARQIGGVLASWGVDIGGTHSTALGTAGFASD